MTVIEKEKSNEDRVVDFKEEKKKLKRLYYIGKKQIYKRAVFHPMNSSIIYLIVENLIILIHVTTDMMNYYI